MSDAIFWFDKAIPAGTRTDEAFDDSGSPEIILGAMSGQYVFRSTNTTFSTRRELRPSFTAMFGLPKAELKHLEVPLNKALFVMGTSDDLCNALTLDKSNGLARLVFLDHNRDFHLDIRYLRKKAASGRVVTLLGLGASLWYWGAKHAPVDAAPKAGGDVRWCQLNKMESGNFLIRSGKKWTSPEAVMLSIDDLISNIKSTDQVAAWV